MNKATLAVWNTSYFVIRAEKKQSCTILHNDPQNQFNTVKQVLFVRLLCMDMIGKSICTQTAGTTFAGWSRPSFDHGFEHVKWHPYWMWCCPIHFESSPALQEISDFQISSFQQCGVGLIDNDISCENQTWIFENMSSKYEAISLQCKLDSSERILSGL